VNAWRRRSRSRKRGEDGQVVVVEDTMVADGGG